jgi:hypothetical protein
VPNSDEDLLPFISEDYTHQELKDAFELGDVLLYWLASKLDRPGLDDPTAPMDIGPCAAGIPGTAYWIPDSGDSILDLRRSWDSGTA